MAYFTITFLVVPSPIFRMFKPLKGLSVMRPLVS